MKRITLIQLQNILAGIRGATPIAISALVDARARVNPFAAIAKFSVVNGFTGFDYENSVNRQLDREGKDQLTFAAKERSWGQVVSPALVENKGKYYLRLKVEKTRKPLYLTKQTESSHWLITAKEKIVSYLPPARHATNQGTDKEIVYRNYSLDNIVALSHGGEKYRVMASA